MWHPALDFEKYIFLCFYTIRKSDGQESHIFDAAHCPERSSCPKQDATLFMAGCYQIYNGQNRFVILTTQANASVAPVHERMPLLLERQELEDWIMEDAAVEFILAKKPILLNRTAEYEQLKLFS